MYQEFPQLTSERGKRRSLRSCVVVPRQMFSVHQTGAFSIIMGSVELSSLSTMTKWDASPMTTSVNQPSLSLVMIMLTILDNLIIQITPPALSKSTNIVGQSSNKPWTQDLSHSVQLYKSQQKLQ